LKGTLALLATAILVAAVPATGEVNRIVLRVNDRIATLQDYEKLKNERVRALARPGISEEERQRQLANVGVDTMRNLFQEMLLLSRADQLEIRIGPSELQEALESTKQSFGIETDEDYEEALRQSGMTRELLRKQIESSLRIRDVFGMEVYSQIGFEEEDLRRYYGANPDEFRTTAAALLREVIALESAGIDAVALSELAAELRVAIAAGEVDQLLAETEAAGSTTAWIDLGWVEAGDLDTQLEAAIDGLETGGVSEPTEARGGLHILQVLERREARVRDFAEVREQLEIAERARRIEKRQAEYLRELEDEAFIVANPPLDAAGFRAEVTTDEPIVIQPPESVAEPGPGGESQGG
jgi:parvulin-like peptidyl-prolyl isomerase